MSEKWAAISESDFNELFEEQYSRLPLELRSRFDRFRVPLRKVVIRRSEAAGNESVFVVAARGTGVLYFDDVEYGFNVSEVGGDGQLVSPGGSQSDLEEAIERWFPNRVTDASCLGK